MNEEFVLYNDGQHVKITSHVFIVDSVKYLVKGIASVRMRLIRHYKYPPFIMLLLGIAGIIMGIIHTFSNVKITFIGDFLISANKLSAGIGLLLALLSLLWLSVLNDKYAVIITTAEGDKNPITSTKKDYVSQIISVLKTAMQFRKF